MTKEAMKLALGKIKAARDCHFAAIDTLLFEAEEILEQALAVPVQEPVAHCEAGPNYCWKCLEESNPTFGSEEIKKLREVNKSLMKNIDELKKEPPPFWPVVQHLLDEYGLQFIDVVAAYREATQPEQEPVAYISCEQRKLEWAKYMSWDTPTVVNLPKIPLYTTPPQQQWVGLSEKDRNDIEDYCEMMIGKPAFDAIEAKLKEKNT